MTSSQRDPDTSGQDSRSYDHHHDEHQNEGSSSISLDQGNVARFTVSEMDCPSCAGKVKNSVQKLDGINDVEPQVTSGVLTVSYEDNLTTQAEITLPRLH
ncbi:heavy-metal-associated domain-containing protein [Halalkalicoccus subterraneus]|jgi:Zn2+/Cd2+-exporting ATPase|uniref:heavy-metal-associated domain-containing protein n=1 Tax=Halalkalicoccus subterraneus TaxID=2675002 RepID=UPI000EFD0D63|nr:heavy-metal-associated domain-containing protein [Halalkalicoccus subterraneus]